MADPKIKQTLINAGTVVGSQYAQLVGVSVTDIDITLEFVFVNPRDKTSGQVVSRVTLPLAIGVDLANTILMVAKVHENKKKGDQNARRS
ncbi:hypothetical protein A3F58_00585 [Candidatus Roizmanbacteria bacterium RIFCSPHIGHO2_12_FULL_37_9b]|uniref:Uncharacterized protein n=1 Tax=Candidatus Roizmanbacteria bacterium RIFCSPHIGHO2_02_FULL_38_11 TaxID=1802039 RepID=A0A1F7GWR7_9BACT|nr:MAG: hypothetical protein A3C25_01200 [Candidatus Roizmanbacteria bacterium RIFCSPHIGHO2_02_FULL_38_11]OGK33905.1 MAG: hypothetical protein A3F58_00585 [Candidatus Roizmanbacteria bacterium RIFCSPHIGHO2_12_FULL_37_9b]